MLNLKNIVLQLEQEEYDSFAGKLKANKADKFYRLLQYYREDSRTDDQIRESLKVNANAFYVLKSRLFEKLQEHLLDNMLDPKLELLKKIVTIPTLLFDTNRDMAEAILIKLEKELVEYDLPYELMNVYNALKKIYRHSDKYYEYDQLYNKHVAYTLALDKAEDLLSDFIVKLSDYHANREKNLLELLPLLKKEINHISSLYDSHHLKVYKNIIDISAALFVPLEEAVADDDPVEDILDATSSILSNYPKDINYQYLYNVYNFLAFEYYHDLGVTKKAAQYFNEVNQKLPAFLYYNNYCFCSKFLISKIERYNLLGIERELDKENTEEFCKYQPDKNDIPNYLNYKKYLAASAYYAEKYDQASKHLVDLLNDVSFKKYTHAEIEIKLFLILCYSMVNKYDQAHNLLRSVDRKIRQVNDDMSYDNAVIFAKMMKLQSSTKRENMEEKLEQLKKRFRLLNNSDKKMLEFIKMDEHFIRKLAQTIK